MTKRVTINGYECDIVNGKVKGGWKNGNYKIPYTHNKKYGGWDNAQGDLTESQIRGRMKSGTVRFY